MNYMVLQPDINNNYTTNVELSTNYQASTLNEPMLAAMFHTKTYTRVIGGGLVPVGFTLDGLSKSNTYAETRYDTVALSRFWRSGLSGRFTLRFNFPHE